MGKLEPPNRDQASLDKIRKLILALVEANGGIDSARMFGKKDQVDPVQHLLGTAAGWCGNPRDAALDTGDTPAMDDGVTPCRITHKDLPVDGFWSIGVSDNNGFFKKNAANSYTVDNATARPNADGSLTTRCGGDGSKPNTIPITSGWNDILRKHKPRAELLDGTWKPPVARVVK